MNKLKAAMLLTLLTLGFAVTNAEAGPLTIRLTTSGGFDSGHVTLGGNIVTFAGPAGSYFVTLTAGSSNNPGSPTNAGISITELAIKNITPLLGTADTTLTIELSQTGFTAPVGPGVILDSSASATYTNAPAGDTVEFTSYINDDNSLFGTTTASPTLTLTAPGGPVGYTQTVSGNAALTYTTITPTFSLTNVTVITLTAAGLLDPVSPLQVAGAGDTVVSQQVPEPTSLVLLGLGLLGAGFTRRRRS